MEFAICCKETGQVSFPCGCDDAVSQATQPRKVFQRDSSCHLSADGRLQKEADLDDLIELLFGHFGDPEPLVTDSFNEPRARVFRRNALDGATGISVWWRDHADHHMRVLMDPQGPFYNCDKSGHRDPAHLEPKRAPEGWFPDVRLQG